MSQTSPRLTTCWTMLDTLCTEVGDSSFRIRTIDRAVAA